MNKVLSIALAKLKPFNNGKEWVAPLTSAELVALCDDGYVLSLNNNHTYEDAKADMSNGKAEQHWCYFTRVGTHKPMFTNELHKNKNKACN